MIGSAVAKRYATALFGLAEEKKVADQVAENLDSLAAAWESSEELRRCFQSPQFGAEQKRDVMRALADRLRCHPIVKNTMLMLSDRRRLEHLPDIAEAYTRLAEKRAGRLRAEVVSAGPLPESYFTKLSAALKKSTGKEIVLVKKEDPSLIGGVVTTVGGRVFDGSLKNHLRELKNELLTSTDPALAER